MAEISMFSSHSFEKHMATDHQECVQTAMCMCALGKPQLCVPHFPCCQCLFIWQLTFGMQHLMHMSIPLCLQHRNIGHGNPWTWATAQKGTWTCICVLKPLLWECNRAEICLVQVHQTFISHTMLRGTETTSPGTLCCLGKIRNSSPPGWCGHRGQTVKRCAWKFCYRNCGETNNSWAHQVCTLREREWWGLPSTSAPDPLQTSHPESLVPGCEPCKHSLLYPLSAVTSFVLGLNCYLHNKL